jgi:hypothetical protein
VPLSTWHPLPGQVYTNKAADCPRVVRGNFHALVRQAEALLGQVHPEHPLAADGRPAAAFTLGVIGLDFGHQFGPRRNRIYLGQEPVKMRRIALVVELQF